MKSLKFVFVALLCVSASFAEKDGLTQMAAAMDRFCFLMARNISAKVLIG